MEHQKLWIRWRRITRIDIGISGPALGFLGPTYLCPGRHICVPADISGAGVNSGILPTGICVFWPEYASAGRIIPISAYSDRNLQVLGRHDNIPADLGRHSKNLVQAGSSPFGWSGLCFILAGPSWPPRCSSARPSRPPPWASATGRPWPVSPAGQAPTGPSLPRAMVHRAGFPASWAGPWRPSLTSSAPLGHAPSWAPPGRTVSAAIGFPLSRARASRASCGHAKSPSQVRA
jgi:hypothetical protein